MRDTPSFKRGHSAPLIERAPPAGRAPLPLIERTPAR